MVIRRSTDNTMTKRKKNKQTLHRELKIEPDKPHSKSGWSTVTAPYVYSINIQDGKEPHRYILNKWSVFKEMYFNL